MTPTNSPSAPEAPGRPSPNSRIAGIDGLRALAALAVFFLHTGHGYAKGGGIGVSIFFVISGLVITRSLLHEYDARGSINMPAFYLRRAVRLWPALIVLVLAVWMIYPTEKTLIEEVLPSLFYYANWTRLHGEGPWHLSHTWTLASEEQFYLVWPFALLLCLKAFKADKVMILTVVFALIPATWKIALIFQQHSAPSDLLKYLDLWSEGLFLGAALVALVRYPSRANPA